MQPFDHLILRWVSKNNYGMSCSVVSHGFPLCEKMRAFGVSHFLLIPLPWQTGALRHNDYTSEHNHAFLSTMLSLVLQIQPWQSCDSETSGWHDWQTHLLYQKAGRARPGGPFAHCATARRNWWRAHQPAHNELCEAQNKCSIVWATFCRLLFWEKVAPTQSSGASVIFGPYQQLEGLLHPFVQAKMINAHEKGICFITQFIANIYVNI